MRKTASGRVPGLEMRVDPNAAWSVRTSINIPRQMMEYNLEYAEDPTRVIEGMRLVRKDIPVPFAMNMCVINFDQIFLAVRTRCVAIFLADIHHWGGHPRADPRCGSNALYDLLAGFP